MFWEIGQTQDGKAVLLNPQAQNSYSYAQNNPITNKDPDGRCGLVCAIAYGLFLPSVAEAPAPGQELTTGQNLRSGLFIASFAPVGGGTNLSSNLTGDTLQVGLQAARQDALNGIYRPLSDYVGEISAGSYSQLKGIIGTAGDTIGKDFQWHHIVEQRNASQFGQEIIQNTNNIVALPKDIHQVVSNTYSAKPFVGAMSTLRQSIGSNSYSQQLQQGLSVLSDVLSKLKSKL